MTEMDLTEILDKQRLRSFSKKFREENMTIENIDTMDTKLLKGLGFK